MLNKKFFTKVYQKLPLVTTGYQILPVVTRSYQKITKCKNGVKNAIFLPKMQNCLPVVTRTKEKRTKKENIYNWVLVVGFWIKDFGCWKKDWIKIWDC